MKKKLLACILLTMILLSQQLAISVFSATTFGLNDDFQSYTVVSNAKTDATAWSAKTWSVSSSANWDPEVIADPTPGAPAGNQVMRLTGPSTNPGSGGTAYQLRSNGAIFTSQFVAFEHRVYIPTNVAGYNAVDAGRVTNVQLYDNNSNLIVNEAIIARTNNAPLTALRFTSAVDDMASTGTVITDIPILTDKWYKVLITIDIEAKRYNVSVTQQDVNKTITKTGLRYFNATTATKQIRRLDIFPDRQQGMMMEYFDDIKLTGYDYQDLVDSEALALTLPNVDLNNVGDNIRLPLLTDIYNMPVTWSSDNIAVVDNSGNVFLSAVNETVTLTATVTSGGKTAQKNFILTVKRALAAINYVANQIKPANLTAELPNLLTQDFSLEADFIPNDYKNAVNIEWKSSN